MGFRVANPRRILRNSNSHRMNARAVDGPHRASSNSTFRSSAPDLGIKSLPWCRVGFKRAIPENLAYEILVSRCCVGGDRDLLNRRSRQLLALFRRVPYYV